MSRFLLLFLFLIWFAWRPDESQSATVETVEIAGFLAFYGLLVLGLGLWSRLVAARTSGHDIRRGAKRFNQVMSAARIVVPAWFAVGVFALNWGEVVRAMLGPVADWPAQLPGVILGTLPAMLAWIGLWWSQFPADRAMREQSLLIQLDNGAPIHAPPSLGAYMRSNLRLQLLFTAVPVLLILLMHDVLFTVMWQTGLVRQPSEELQAATSLGSALIVFFFAPEILRRVLHTEPLVDSPLRRRLEALCRQHDLRYREILLWRTNGTMGNAAVMGLAPRLRYILLSDLLLETLTDEQIEAVFAHEVGHIVHRHMAWYLIFFTALLLLSAGPGEWLGSWLSDQRLPDWLPIDLVLMLASVGVFFVTFGFVSRRFERQADVFAARTVERGSSSATSAQVQTVVNAPIATDVPAPSGVSIVGPHGASVLASALQRVAAINGIPIQTWSWCHGSIARRMHYVRRLGSDPKLTHRFDRIMTILNLGLLTACVLGAVWLYLTTRG